MFCLLNVGFLQEVNMQRNNRSPKCFLGDFENLFPDESLKRCEVELPG